MFETLLMFLAAVAVIILLLYVIFLTSRKRPKVVRPLGQEDRKLLQQHVVFYNGLDEQKQLGFEGRLQHFLASTRISGVNTEVERLDELSIAASAIIPIFGFHN